MRWFRAMRIIFVLAVFALLAAHSFAQNDDDPNEAPLGDVARNLRKKSAPAQPVIDDDNLRIVMQQSESHRSASSAWKFLMGAGDKGFQVSQPDVSCSLSFTANARSLLTRQYAQMDLPADETQKLEGPAAIEGDALTVSLFNGTNWHVSEVEVALTVIRNAGLGALSFDPASFVSRADNGQDAESPSKKPDITFMYRMRAAAAPLATTIFSAPLNEEIAPGEEWHWAVVQARGYPPESYTAAIPPSAPTHPSITSNQLPVAASAVSQSQSAPVSLSQVPQ